MQTINKFFRGFAFISDNRHGTAERVSGLSPRDTIDAMEDAFDVASEECRQRNAREGWQRFTPQRATASGSEYAIWRQTMEQHNETLRNLISRAELAAARFRNGTGSFAAAVHAYDCAADWADEGPGDPITEDEQAAIDRTRALLPEWAT